MSHTQGLIFAIGKTGLNKHLQEAGLFPVGTLVDT